MIAVSHPTGNEFVRHLLIGLAEKNLLHQYYTSLATFPDDWIHKFGLNNLIPELNKRLYDKKYESKTSCFPTKEILRQLSLKLEAKSLIQHEKGPFCIDKIYQHHDQLTANRIKKTKKELSGIYAYEDGALHSFEHGKEFGLNRFYDLPIGYWKLGIEILENEKNRTPEYASSLTGLANSKEKLEKKDREIDLSTHLIVASSFTQKSLELYGGKVPNIQLIPYGFPQVSNTEKKLSKKNSLLKVLYVGGITQRKGIAEVFEMAEQFKNHIQLTIIGKKTIFENKLIDQNLKKHIWIPSLNHSDILAEMGKHDVLLFPSFFEGYGLVINEAMSQGTPVITTRNTGGGDCIEHGVNGWLVQPGNSNEIKSVIEQLILNRELIQQTSTEAKKTALNRPWSKYSEDLVNFLVEPNQPIFSN